MRARTRSSMVADVADCGGVGAGGVGQVPFLAAAAGDGGAGVAAAHADDDVGGVHDFLGPGFGEFPGDVDTDFAHGVDDALFDAVAGGGAAGPAGGAVTGEMGEESECHLRASGVVGAQERHRGCSGAGVAFDFGQRT